MVEARYNEADAKGARFLAMLTTCSTVCQNPYVSHSDLATHVYDLSALPESFKFEPLRACLRGLGADNKLSDHGG